MSAPRPVPTRRPGTAMVGVMVLVLVMAGLAGTLLTSARSSRRKTRKVARYVQREMVLDAALVHGFHELKAMELPADDPLKGLDPTEGSGELSGVPYRFRFTPEPETSTVRIDAEVGGSGREDQGGGKQEGYAVAYLRVQQDDYQTIFTWSLRYYGPESPEKGEL